MGFASSELSNQGQYRRCILRPSSKTPKNHPGVLTKGTGKTGTGKELNRVPVIERRRPGNHLLQGDGKLVGVERSSFTHLMTWNGYFIPWFHKILLSCQCLYVLFFLRP